MKSDDSCEPAMCLGIQTSGSNVKHFIIPALQCPMFLISSLLISTKENIEEYRGDPFC